MTILQQYNGMDTIATFALWQEFKPRLASDPATARQYDLTMKLYAPALFAMIRGILVDQETMDQLRVQFEAENKALEAKLDVITRGLGMGVINLASPQQKMWLLECLGAKLPMKYDPKVGKSRPSTDRDSLEKLSKSDPELSPVCNIIMAWQNRAKMLSVLQPELMDRDGRMRTGYKIASTVTDRWSSGKNCLWTGMNMQNIKRDEDEEEVGHASIRSMFVADPGYKFINIDLKGADTWAIALEVFKYTGDKSLLNMLLNGDVHTEVAKMVWPGLGWTGDKKKDKKIAGQFFYRQYDYRFMCKKGGHGCVPATHEVLTPSGWTSIANKPPIIMAFNDNGTLEWQTVSNWTDQEFEGNLVSLRGTSLSLDATPDHRVIVTYSQKEGIFREVPAEHVDRGYIPLGWGWVGGTKHEPYAKLIAAIQADGHIASTNRVKFHLRKPRKIQRLMSICDELGVDLWNSGIEQYTIDFCMDYPKDAGAYLLEWDIESIRAWRNELRSWDGSIGATAVVSTHSVNRKHVEWVQTINRLLGFGGNIQKPTSSGFGSTIYKVMENNRKYATVASLSKTPKPFTGRVYCPTVPSEKFLVRHQGKIHVTGNTNYYGTAAALAMQMKIPRHVAENFQFKYYKAVPGLRPWQEETITELETTGTLTNLYNRIRRFHKRLDDNKTHKEAIAWKGQSVTARTINECLLRVFACSLQMPWLNLQFLAQVHDSILGQFEDQPEIEAEVIDVFEKACRIPITVTSKATGETITISIPIEISTGWNWAKESKSNPDGLREYTGTMDDRQRTKTPILPKPRFMDRRVCGVY